MNKTQVHKMNSMLNVRKASRLDAEALFQVQRAADLAAFAHIFPPDRFPFPDDAERARWRQYFDSVESSVLMAEQEAQVLGSVVLTGDVLERLVVHPAHWGRGIGSRLHDEAVERFRQQGSDACRLMVLEDNHRARRFYEVRGWKPDGRRTNSIFPPHPVVLGYTLSELAGRRAYLAARGE